MRAITPTTGEATRSVRPPFYRRLFMQVFTATMLGALLENRYPDNGSALKPLDDGFITLIKMIIALIIFIGIATGISGMRDWSAVDVRAAAMAGQRMPLSEEHIGRHERSGLRSEALAETLGRPS